MNKRLVWNFEINQTHLLQIPSADSLDTNSCHWESRFFWPETEIIPLMGLDDHFLQLSLYKIKPKEDTYFLLPHYDYNLKSRDGQLFYKPLIKKERGFIAYSKKERLVNNSFTHPLWRIEKENDETDVAYIQQHALQIQISKVVFIYTFAVEPKVKMELARLSINNKIYFSVAIESKALPLVESITKQVLGRTNSTDYVSFLKEITS